MDNDTFEVVVWEPDLGVVTAHQASNLTVYLNSLAERYLQQEVMPDDDRFPKVGSPEYEAHLAELTLRLVINWIAAGEASHVQILEWIEREHLYLWRGWETLGQMVTNVAAGLSDSGRSVYTRLVEKVLPYLKDHDIAQPLDVMGVMLDGRSKLYHMMPYLERAVERNKPRVVRAMFKDIASPQTRQQVLARWRDKVPIPAAPAELRKDGEDLWTLTITMTDAQKRLVLTRLRDRIALLEEP